MRRVEVEVQLELLRLGEEFEFECREELRGCDCDH